VWTRDPLIKKARAFKRQLDEIRAERPMDWYPYDSLNNIDLMTKYFPEEILDAATEGALDWKLLDIGAGDGEVGFFFETTGCKVDMLDNPSTNFNDCRGIGSFAEALSSPSKLVVRDIDHAFELEGQYDLALALGLLYHLRNPMNLLLTLAMHAERLALSTRVFRFLPDGTSIEKYPVAYYLRNREANNDPTNYWILSPLALKAMLARSGWRVVGELMQGPTLSNPIDMDADERMYVYCERVENWRDLHLHHDFG
jgi:tRNA (mo5U34)-methyltransferase